METPILLASLIVFFSLLILLALRRKTPYSDNTTREFRKKFSLKGFDEIIPYLRHEDYRVRATAVAHLYKLDRQQTIKVLGEMLTGSDQETKWFSAKTLAALYDPNAKVIALEPLRAELAQHNPETYGEAIRALSQTRSSLAVGDLLSELRHTKPGWDNFYDRVALVRALGELRDGQAIPDLEEVTRTDTQKFDGWGMDVGISVGELAEDALKKIRTANSGWAQASQ